MVTLVRPDLDRVCEMKPVAELPMELAFVSVVLWDVPYQLTLPRPVETSAHDIYVTGEYGGSTVCYRGNEVTFLGFSSTPLHLGGVR